MSTRPQSRNAEPMASATLSEIDGIRYLHLGTPWVQGAMHIRQPQRIVLEYIQRMMVWLLRFDPAQWPQLKTLQLGLGAGAITRFCHGKLHMDCTAVEINPSVIAANRMWFRLKDQPGCRIHQEDAGVFAADPGHHGQFDAICIDLYDHEAAAPVLDSADFYRQCRALLSPEGALTVNLFGRHASFEDSHAALQEAFGAEKIWRLRATREGNTVLLGWKGQDWPERAVLRERADAIESQLGLPARKWLKMWV